jgi:lipopolysaccharide transport system ATP-binding protein
MSDVAIRVEGLGKQYRIGARQERYKTLRESLSSAASLPLRAARAAADRARGRGRGRGGASAGAETFWALRDVSFDVPRGEVVGIVGRNGAGKSTLLKVLSRITEPTAGWAEIRGRVGSLLEVGTGFHPELTGRENIYLNGAILGMRRTEIDRKFDQIVEFAEVDKFVDTAVKHYSSGMYLRLAFAVAAHLEPEILLVDEVLAVGDMAFQQKCLGKMEDVAKHGRTVLFISHNMGAVRSLCTSGIYLDHGSSVACPKVADAINLYYGSAGRNGDAPASDDGRSGFGPLSLDGIDGNTVDQSSGFTVTTHFRSKETRAVVYIYLFLDDSNGRRVFSLREDGRSIGLGELKVGDNRVRVELPPLWLNPGLYSLHFKLILGGGYGSTRYLSDTFPLDVAGASSIGAAVLQPGARWSVQ